MPGAWQFISSSAQRRRRGIFVEPRTKMKSSPVGAAYSAPTELGLFLISYSTNRSALRASRWHGDAGGLAPDADLGIIQAINGLVGPLHRRGGERLRVGVAGRGVNGQQHKAFAIGAIHLDFATVQKGAVAARPISHSPDCP